MSMNIMKMGIAPLLPGSAKKAGVPDDTEHDHDPVVIVGTNRPDDIVSGGGPQQILGLSGADTIHAGGGPDEIEGGNGGDSIFAQGGPDTVEGGNGKDLVDGGGGPDVIDGGNGKDIIIGCMGPDILTGGRGPDTFIYRSANEAPAHGDGSEGEPHSPGEDEGQHDESCMGGSGSGGQEIITDFDPGKDQIDFSAIGTITGLSDGPDEYSIWAVQQGQDTMLYADTNGSVAGDHPAEIGILLLGVEASSLTMDDFIL